MQDEKHYHGQSEDEIWAQVQRDLNSNPDAMQYRAFLHPQNKEILLDIDIDLGGGFEGGYATTIFSASLPNRDGFRFAIHEDGFFDDLGKFFGMQDVEIGFKEFDEQLIVKTNDESRVRTIFQDEYNRQTIMTLKDFTFEMVVPDTDPGSEDSTLELIIEEGITDPVRLRAYYRMFLSTLHLINPFNH